ncbi:MAG: thymidine kinase [Chloracidobacterium sp. CP2_5A]|nr:MAG: thymidine kinase [Chloracidobacterium sp. CP2_5A]
MSFGSWRQRRCRLSQWRLRRFSRRSPSLRRPRLAASFLEDSRSLQEVASADALARPRGWIEVIAGGMFSGKTEALITRLRRALIARQAVQAFKPRLDDRYEADFIVSHSQLRIKTQLVEQAEDILDCLSPATQVVGIDEGQFLGGELVDVCCRLADEGRRVIVAALDLDYRGEPFEPIPRLLAMAEYVTKPQAICVVCGDPANFSQRLTADERRVVVGADGLYEARCRRCFVPYPVPPSETVKSEAAKEAVT